MINSFREVLKDLRQKGHVEDITNPVDIRDIGALVDESEKALVFHNVNDYSMPVVSGVANSRERIGAAFGCSYEDVYKLLDLGLSEPIEPKLINGGPVREVFITDDEVDLFELPVPLFSIHDGGPMITAGVTIAKNASGSLNAGIYRFLLREKNITGIDIVTPNDLQLLALEAFRRNESLPITINIGTHLAINVSATYRAPMNQNELAIAGGLMGTAVRLTPGETIDVPCISDAEIVLEAEILPTGWTKPEGRFGEFTRLMGGLHWNLSLIHI